MGGTQEDVRDESNVEFCTVRMTRLQCTLNHIFREPNTNSERILVLCCSEYPIGELYLSQTVLLELTTTAHFYPFLANIQKNKFDSLYGIIQQHTKSLLFLKVIMKLYDFL